MSGRNPGEPSRDARVWSRKQIADRFSSGSPKNTIHKTGIPIAALDISPQKTHAVLAGREILQTIEVSAATCVEDFDLRSAVINYAATRNTVGGAIPAKHKDQLAANDVKWSHGRFDTTIGTAAANGQIVIYDITRAGVELARLHEHVRQVHRVAFNPHQGALLLSGSQDATMRLWDLRALAGDRSIMTCRSSLQYPGNNEGIRDLRWSPTNGVEFAAGTDNGVVQRWDFRKAGAPMLKVNAHEKTCHSIDWHPDGKHLVSGGADKVVNVWDFSSTDRRKKACWQLRAPQAVLNVRWRPPHGGTPGPIAGDGQWSQIVTSYDHQDPRIHVWDFRRPFMPVREIHCYETAPTAMLWQSEDLLWSVGMQGIFAQTDVNGATPVLDTRSPSVFALAPGGQIGIVAERRTRPPRPQPDATEDFLNRPRGPGGGGEKMSRSHSATDESFEEASVLSSSFKNRHRKLANPRSAKSSASTPPLGGTGASTISLEEAMRKEHTFQPSQVAAHGHVLGLFDAPAFTFLARHYKSSPTRSSTRPIGGWASQMAENFRFNAMLAANTHEYRLAQSWRVLGLAIEKECQARTAIHGDQRQSLFITARPDKRLNACDEADVTAPGPEKVPSASEITKQRRELVSLQAAGQSSNMTTPLVRPIAGSPNQAARSNGPSSSVAEENLLLPAPAWEDSVLENPSHTLPNDRIGTDSLHVYDESQEQIHEGNDVSQSSTSPGDGVLRPERADLQLPLAGFSDLDSHLSERRAAMENYKVTPRPLLRLEEPVHTLSQNHILSLRRDESTDQSHLFSTSTDSFQLPSSVAGSSGSSLELANMELEPRQADGMMPHGTANRVSPGKTNAVKDCLGQPPREPVPLELSADDLDHILPTQSFVNRTPSVGLAPSPFARRPDLEPPVIHFDDMEHSRDSKSSDATIGQEAKPDHPTPDHRYATPDLTNLRPWAAASMIDWLITYHTAELCSSQLPANILLQLGPLCNPVCPALVLSVLLSYHAQLVSLSLHAQAASLRKQAFPDYPDVSDHGSYGINPGGPWCTVCQKPSKGDRRRFCQRCNQPWADCPICNGEGAPAVANNQPIRQSDSLWGWCQWCGHGGHLGCLRLWWDLRGTSDGGCATAGCLHDCVPGARREAIHQRKVAAKRASTIKDEWVVGESRAVERTRNMVRGPGEEGGSPGGTHPGARNAKALRGPQGPLSLGILGRSGSGGKKVRVLTPVDDDEREPRESDRGRGNGRNEATAGAGAGAGGDDVARASEP